MLTPYQFASNDPICSIDLEGLEGIIFTEGEELGQTKRVTKTIIALDVFILINNPAGAEYVNNFTARDLEYITNHLQVDFNGVVKSNKLHGINGSELFFDFNISLLDASLEGIKNVSDIRNFALYNAIKTDDPNKLSMPAVLLLQKRSDLNGDNGITSYYIRLAEDYQNNSTSHEVAHFLLSFYQNQAYSSKNGSDHALGGLMSNPPQSLNQKTVDAMLGSLPTVSSKNIYRTISTGPGSGLSILEQDIELV